MTTPPPSTRPTPCRTAPRLRQFPPRLCARPPDPGRARRLAAGPPGRVTWLEKARGWLRGRRDLIGPGHLILVVGPSGAGKDTVLTLVRAATQHDETIVFPRRVVTRPVDGAEDHDSSTDAEFDRAVADGAFSVWWSAHENKYGIPVSAEDAIRVGRTVVCNVSRGVVTSLRERYAAVTVVMVTA